VPRTTIVTAKFIVVVLWSAGVTVWLLVVGLVLGALLRLPGWDAGVVAAGLGRAMLALLLMILAVSPVPLIACIGRGYLPPLGAALAAVVVAQVAAALGAASLLPWAIPAVAVGLVPRAELGGASWLIIAVTGVAGVTGTIAWWHRGDAGL
jgi:ABC-2 type transport system permease protein